MPICALVAYATKAQIGMFFDWFFPKKKQGGFGAYFWRSHLPKALQSGRFACIN